MNISCALSGIADIRHPMQGILDIAGANFKNLCFDMAKLCPPEQLENIGNQHSALGVSPTTTMLVEHPEELCNIAKTILDLCAKNQLHCSVSIAPYLNRDTKREDLNILIEQLAMGSIKACGQAGCRFLVVRPLFAGIPDKDIWEKNKEYYLNLAVCAKEYGVHLLLENQCKDIHGHMIRGICADAGVAAEWVDRLNAEVGEERFGFCMDAGACNLCGQHMHDFIMTLGNRLKAVILRDCDGSTESSLLPFTSVKKRGSQTDWLDLIRGLRELGFDGELIMNFEDTAAAFSPILRSELVRMGKSVADYFKWQIEIESVLKRSPSRVLFGAGNMCRNYMKCYGEKYLPLYTCDNNKKLWDTEFCGLKVRNPEALKELPEDCVILICNIYYREIEAQIKQMGVRNTIEFFNDEYMPSFHFDRVER